MITKVCFHTPHIPYPSSRNTHRREEVWWRWAWWRSWERRECCCCPPSPWTSSVAGWCSGPAAGGMSRNAEGPPPGSREKLPCIINWTERETTSPKWLITKFNLIQIKLKKKNVQKKNLDEIDSDLEIPYFAIQDHLIHHTFMPVFKGTLNWITVIQIPYFRITNWIHPSDEIRIILIFWIKWIPNRVQNLEKTKEQVWSSSNVRSDYMIWS